MTLERSSACWRLSGVSERNCAAGRGTTLPTLPCARVLLGAEMFFLRGLSRSRNFSDSRSCLIQYRVNDAVDLVSTSFGAEKVEEFR